MFEGFEKMRIKTSESDIFLQMGGEGPPLFLLHGYPQTHLTWHEVAPILKKSFTLLVPDLRGYGESIGPAPDESHTVYSKRAMAGDIVEIAEHLGYKDFFFAGHDRGARVGYRLALDHPDRVKRLALIDIIPTLEVWKRMDYKAALKTYHWLFLSQPAPMPESLIGSNPEFYIKHLLDRWIGPGARLNQEAVFQYVKYFSKKSVIEATCEDYRAGSTIDIQHDLADQEAGRRIACPTLIVWGKGYLADKARSPLEVWRSWALDVQETALDCGHFVQEELPLACADALQQFFQS